MVIGGVPVTVSHLIMAAEGSRTYAGVPILTLLSPTVTLVGFGTNDPSSISGRSPRHNASTYVYTHHISIALVYCVNTEPSIFTQYTRATYSCLLYQIKRSLHLKH